MFQEPFRILDAIVIEHVVQDLKTVHHSKMREYTSWGKQKNKEKQTKNSQIKQAYK